MGNTQTLNSASKPLLFVVETKLDDGVWFAMPGYWEAGDSDGADDLVWELNSHTTEDLYRVKAITDPAEAQSIIEECPL